MQTQNEKDYLGSDLYASHRSAGNGTARVEYPFEGAKTKIKVTKDGIAYLYDHKSDVTVVPLQMGNGEYLVEVFRLKGNMYAKVLSGILHDKSDKFAVFSNPNIMVKYNEYSKCVIAAKNIAKGCSKQTDIITKIAEHIKEKLEYDYEEAKAVKDANGMFNHLCTVDSIYSSGKGICLDYSVLFAAMLRSVGIPCKLIFGYINGGTAYHAWNEVYIPAGGGGKWVTYDMTFEDAGVKGYNDYRVEKFY